MNIYSLFYSVVICVNQIQLSVCLFVCLFIYFLVKTVPLQNYLPRTSSGSFPSIATSNVIKNMINTVSFIAISDSAEQSKRIKSVSFGIVDCFRIAFLL